MALRKHRVRGGAVRNTLLTVYWLDAHLNIQIDRFLPVLFEGFPLQYRRRLDSRRASQEGKQRLAK